MSKHTLRSSAPDEPEETPSITRNMSKATVEPKAEVLHAHLDDGATDVETICDPFPHLVLQVFDSNGGVLLKVTTIPYAPIVNDLAGALLAAAAPFSPAAGSARTWAVDVALAEGQTLVVTNGARVLLLHMDHRRIEADGAPAWAVFTPDEARTVAALVRQPGAAVEAELAAFAAEVTARSQPRRGAHA